MLGTSPTSSPEPQTGKITPLILEQCLISLQWRPNLHVSGRRQVLWSFRNEVSLTVSQAKPGHNTPVPPIPAAKSRSAQMETFSSGALVVEASKSPKMAPHSPPSHHSLLAQSSPLINVTTMSFMVAQAEKYINPLTVARRSLTKEPSALPRLLSTSP
jgi:hypothetical protein